LFNAQHRRRDYERTLLLRGVRDSMSSKKFREYTHHRVCRPLYLSYQQ
jgi:hypothetical protein